MVELAKELEDALRGMRQMRQEEIVAALPKELITGMDTGLLGELLGRYRESLYPETVTIDLASSQRVADSLKVGGLLAPNADVAGLQDTSIVGG